MNSKQGNIAFGGFFIMAIFAVGIVVFGMRQPDVTPEFYHGAEIQCQNDEGLKYLAADLGAFHVRCNNKKMYYSFSTEDALANMSKERNGNLP